MNKTYRFMIDGVTYDIYDICVQNAISKLPQQDNFKLIDIIFKKPLAPLPPK